MNNQLATTNNHSSIIEQVAITGDLAQLQPKQRVEYYQAVCQSLGLNPLTKPFDYINLNGKLTLYAKKDCTEQLRKIHKISIERLEREQVGDLYMVTAYAKNSAGRIDIDSGAVAIKGIMGDKLANAMMKAVTKAKRRVTLSICGLGWVDEAELETIPTAQAVEVVQGEIIELIPATTTTLNEWAQAVYSHNGTASILPNAGKCQAWYTKVVGDYNPQYNEIAAYALENYVVMAADGITKSIAFEHSKDVFSSELAIMERETGDDAEDEDDLFPN